MMPFVAMLVRQLGAIGCIVLGMLAFYEGVPALRDIPGVASIPMVRELIAGRVATVAADAAERARAGLVALAELAAAQARADKLAAELAANARLADEARRQAVAARIEAQLIRSELEKRIAEDKDPSISRWTERDLERLRQQPRGSP